MTTLTSRITPPSRPIAVGAALLELRGALRHLMSAVVATLSTNDQPLTDTVAQQATRVRDMARRFQATDPGFASDLYAAADRHEIDAQG